MTSGTRPHDALAIPALARAAGTVDLPGSKSISNRVLLLAALADGTTELLSLLDADDVARMREALATLGVVLRAGERAAGASRRGRARTLSGRPGRTVPRQRGDRRAPAHRRARDPGWRLHDPRRAAHVRATDRRPGGAAAPHRLRRTLPRQCGLPAARDRPERCACRRDDRDSRRRIEPVPLGALDGAAAGRRGAARRRAPCASPRRSSRDRTWRSRPT